MQTSINCCSKIQCFVKGVGPWSDFSYNFVTAGPVPDNAPLNVKLTALDQDVKASWDEVQPAPMEGKILGYVVRTSGTNYNTHKFKLNLKSLYCWFAVF